MIAVLNIDGRQLKVEKNQEFYVNRLQGKEGDKLTFETISLIQDGATTTTGTPLVKDAQVKIAIIEHIKDKKVIVFKKKRRKGYKVKNGHRQALTEIIVEKVSEKIVKAKPTKKSAEDKSSKTKKAAPKAKSKK